MISFVHQSVRRTGAGGSVDVSLGRQGHRCNFPEELVAEFVNWLEETSMSGYAGKPERW